MNGPRRSSYNVRHLRLKRLLRLAFFLAYAAAALGLANWRPLVRNGLFRRAEDRVSTWVTASFTSVRPLAPGGAPGIPLRRRLAVYEPGELVRMWQAGRRPPAGAFAVLANTPSEYENRPQDYQAWLLQASTEAAVAVGVGAVIDCSAADRLRCGRAGRETAEELRAAGILRAVVFDGGHHLPGLALEPEILLIPVLIKNGRAYACHASIRDAVPLPALLRAMRRAGLRTACFTAPRLLTMAKSKNAMALLLTKAMAARKVGVLRGAGAYRRILASDLAGLARRIQVPKNALDLLLGF